MCARFLAATVILGLSFSVAFTGDPKTDDAKNIQGTWKIESITWEGSAQEPPNPEIAKARIKITTDRVIFIVDGKEKSSTYRLNPTKKPKEIDLIELVKTAGKDKDGATTIERISPAVYELNGDELTICAPMVKPVAKGDKAAKVEPLVRPSELKAVGKNALMVLKRESSAKAAAITVRETAADITIETDALSAKIKKTGYVSGIAAGSLLDKKTGARDAGFGLHIMDFLLAPGWRDDDYGREKKYHGDLPKHYVEGPQICTQAKKLEPEIIKGDDFVAVRLKFTFTQAGKGYKAGSVWQQTLVFVPKERYIFCSESITSANDVDNLLYRIDMPGHVKHKAGDTFDQIYLSYHGVIPAKEFAQDFPPDGRFLYQRKDDKLPQRMIRGYQLKGGPWIAGLTLDPTATVEAWCHQRGYVCFIQELHGRKVKAGETFGAAYIVGYFDDVAAMERAYDKHKGAKRIEIDGKRWALK